MSDTSTKKHRRQIHYLPDLIDLYDTELLFPDITYNSVKCFFTRLFEKLGIEASIHSFRHTFASCCHHVGFRDKQVQIYLAHKRITTTMDVYTHILKNQSSPIMEYLKRLKEFVDTIEKNAFCTTFCTTF